MTPNSLASPGNESTNLCTSTPTPRAVAELGTWRLKTKSGSGRTSRRGRSARAVGADGDAVTLPHAFGRSVVVAPLPTQPAVLYLDLMKPHVAPIRI